MDGQPASISRKGLLDRVPAILPDSLMLREHEGVKRGGGREWAGQDNPQTIFSYIMGSMLLSFRFRLTQTVISVLTEI
jgi:hypothetical protein